MHFDDPIPALPSRVTAKWLRERSVSELMQLEQQLGKELEQNDVASLDPDTDEWNQDRGRYISLAIPNETAARPSRSGTRPRPAASNRHSSSSARTRARSSDIDWAILAVSSLGVIPPQYPPFGAALRQLPERRCADFKANNRKGTIMRGAPLFVPM